ncbi:hypothetical protein RUND412_006998 [Rhizina undulata]
MANGVLTTYVIVDLLFLSSGILLIAVATVWMGEMAVNPTIENVARMLLLKNCPLPAVIGNGGVVIFSFLMTLPAFALPMSRNWLRIHGWLAMVCALFTLILGLNEWIQTLATRANLEIIWGQQSSLTQSMLQQRFDCCGYMNSTSPLYVTDSVCTSDIVAASKEGCVGPFSDYSENWIQNLFTSAFGVVGLDVIMIICAAMLIKYRKEQIRYRAIDQKWGVGNI